MEPVANKNPKLWSFIIITDTFIREIDLFICRDVRFVFDCYYIFVGFLLVSFPSAGDIIIVKMYAPAISVINYLFLKFDYFNVFFVKSNLIYQINILIFLKFAHEIVRLIHAI